MRLLLLTIFLIIISACADTDDPKVLFDKGKYQSAYVLWQPLAKSGDLTAQNYIGIHHYLGLGTSRNLRLAKIWFEKAAIKGFADAQYNLGVMYENGEFVKQDYVIAYMWFYLANQNGNSNAAKHMEGMAEEHKLFPNQMKHAVELSKEIHYNKPE
jgi:uncharacterized protein